MTITPATITWTATALGGSFYRTIVQRETDDGDWLPIAHIYTEATHTFSDYGVRLGVEETYRVVVEDTNNITSTPSATDNITIPSTTSYQIVSNHDPTLNVELEAAEARYQLPGYRTISYTYGRVGAIVDRSGRPGDVIVLTVDLSTGEGPDLWDDLLAISRADQADVPHYTLRGPFGDRYEVEVVFDDAALSGPGVFTTVAVTCIDVGEPVPVEEP